MRIRKTAEDRKAEIVAAALTLADRLGPDRMTTQAVAREVGLSQPGLFRHFPRKQDLWQAVVDRIAEAMEARWTDASAEGPPMDRLTATVLAQLRLIRETPAIPAILFSRELHVENDALRRALAGCMARFRARLAALAEEARAAGALDPDADPDDVALLLLGLVQGLALRWSLSGRAFDPVEEGARLLSLQLRALRAAPVRGSAE